MSNKVTSNNIIKNALESLENIMKAPPNDGITGVI